MAGIWERWQDADGNQLQSCAVITTESKGDMSQLHQRMPVYIDPENYRDWLDCRSEETDTAAELIRGTNPQYQYYPISTAVNNARHEGRDLIEPVS
jgi:putative SOS response-associated peptidase YedK